MAFFYLGSPYSKFHLGMDAAALAACHARGVLVSAGIPCFSPIIHSHFVAKVCKMDPTDYNIWMPSERPIMEAANGLIVLKLLGWQESVGLRLEMDFFNEKGLPIVYMDPGIVPVELFG